MKTDTEAFVKNEYRPPGIKLQDPRNMHLDDIRKVLRHCYNRQAESGPESAFRFALIMGPKKKRLFANYLETPNIQTNSRKKNKGKGKRQEDLLQGLFQINQTEGTPTPDQDGTEDTNELVAGPSNDPSRNVSETRTSSVLCHDDLVRVDMGKMLQLKQRGYEVVGPVNGPNEGLPQYEVPKAWVDDLMAHVRSEGVLTGIPSDAVYYTPVVEPSRRSPIPDNIDPALLANDPPPPTAAFLNPPIGALPLVPATNDHPTTSTMNTAGSVADPDSILPKSAKKKVGKRAKPNLSPQMHQKQTTNKRKKVTDDDLAALEAQQMMQSGSRRRIKPTQRK
jgi:hypothetical protein